MSVYQYDYQKAGSLTEWDRIASKDRYHKRPHALALPTAEDWQGVDVPSLPTKEPLYLKIDDDVLAWYKAKGKGYQKYINAVLRSFMEAQQR